MCKPHFYQKCCNFCWNQNKVSENDNTFERNENCATVFLKWTYFTLFCEINSIKFLLGACVKRTNKPKLEQKITFYLFVQHQKPARKISNCRNHFQKSFFFSFQTWPDNLLWYPAVLQFIIVLLQWKDILDFWLNFKELLFQRKLKVTKYQKLFFLKHHCLKNERNIRQNSALAS